MSNERTWGRDNNRKLHVLLDSDICVVIDSLLYSLGFGERLKLPSLTWQEWAC